MQNMIDEITRLVGSYIPNLVAALAILILGWIVALVISKIVQAALRRTNLNNRLAHLMQGKKSNMITGEHKEKTLDIEKGISKGLFYLIMLFVIVAFFQTLGITLITEPLNRLLNQLFEFAPKLLGAGILLLIAWVIATVLRKVISGALGATKLDEYFGKQAGIKEDKRMPLTKSLGDAIYWLVFLLFLPAVLGALGMEGLLRPVQGMLNKILDFLPNIITAAIIFIVGWFIARIIQRIVTSLLTAIGIDRLTEKANLSSLVGAKGLSGILGIVVYVLILIPVIVAALNALAIEAITRPASNMLNVILGAFPDIFAASLVLIIAYVIGRLVAGLIKSLLTGIGFNKVFVWLGLSKEASDVKQTPSAMIGTLVLVLTMLFAAIEASRLLGFESLAELVSQFMVFAGHIIFGLIIFALGLYLANIVSQKIISLKTDQAGLLSKVTRIAIVLLASAMALRQMGIANEIINIAFGLLLGAVAVAMAIAFGIGGREIAGKKLEQWLHPAKSGKQEDKEGA